MAGREVCLEVSSLRKLLPGCCFHPQAAGSTAVTEDLLQKVFKLQGGKISAEDTEWERKNTCNKDKTTRDLPTGRFMVTDGAEDPEVKEKQRHLFGIPQPQPGGARSQF